MSQNNSNLPPALQAAKAQQELIESLRAENAALKATKAEDADADIAAEIEKLRAENAALAARLDQAKKVRASSFTLKVSEKGGVSVYGVGRWPVTLYQETWKVILGQKDTILEFIDAHKAELSNLEDKQVLAAAAKVEPPKTPTSERRNGPVNTFTLPSGTGLTLEQLEKVLKALAS